MLLVLVKRAWVFFIHCWPSKFLAALTSKDAFDLRDLVSIFKRSSNSAEKSQSLGCFPLKKCKSLDFSLFPLCRHRVFIRNFFLAHKKELHTASCWVQRMFLGFQRKASCAMTSLSFFSFLGHFQLILYNNTWRLINQLLWWPYTVNQNSSRQLHGCLLVAHYSFWLDTIPYHHNAA